MLNRIHRTLLIAAPLALLAGPAAASDSEPDLLGVLGTFVLNGLGPARTMEDIQREERQAADAARAKERAAEAMEKAAAPPPAVTEVQPVAPAADVAPAEALPQIPPSVKIARVEPAKAIAAPAKVDVIPPPPRPRPQSESVKALPPAVSLPPPEPLKSTIAATATVDQAIKLGGPSDLYGRRLMVD
ncbi:hypothetical protein [Magnetospirillum sulfuroxidans]|uniref:Uncharacterized protein n=1 Tax=Magnetospirillum sulfuroxidans TaxID=611300 RepID=A0ABS5IBY8_9PROT|nr:hypothetical protein [Magnetospirillum sulfuroxidans]MBR9971939.1 hypothetical protein [Magnetospirillum sulfuroxidans]